MSELFSGPHLSAPYYQDDSVTIYHADCLEVLDSLQPEPGGCVVTSPPYNKGVRFMGDRVDPLSRTCKSVRFRDGYGIHSDALDPAEYEAWQRAVLRACWAWTAEQGAVFYNHKQRIINGVVWTPLSLNPGLPLRQIIVWTTGVGVNLHPGAFAPAHEWILFFAPEDLRLHGKKTTSAIGDVWHFQPAPAEQGHPAPFPLGLPTRCISATDAPVVLDPFMGTGTTLRAAKDLGRKAIGIEINEAFCEVAAKRLSQEVLDLGA